MAYIGNRPEQGNFRKCDAITTSATATYNLLVGGVAVNPNQNQCIVSLNGVIQSSGNSYTIANSQITMASALTSSDVIDFILILGDTLDVGVPSDDTVGLAQFSATGSPSSSNFLRGDNSWASAGLDGVTTGSGNVTITNGNLVLGTAGKGIDFSATSGTGTSELLDDYEEGTFTPSMASTGGSFTTVGTCSGFYTKVGKMVQVQMELSLTTVGSGSGNIDVTNMPFTSASTGLVHTLMMARETQTAGVVYDVIMSRDVTACVILAPAMANGSGYSINGMYRVA